jgi:dihydrofolate reductase
MRKLKIMEHISLDGVIQQSADDDDFAYSDWTAPYRTPTGRDLLLATHGGHFDLLLGRRTYDMWSGSWPQAPSSPMADGINAATKYVATHHPKVLHGARSRALDRTSSRAFAASSRRISSQLIELGLVDEYRFVVGANRCRRRKTVVGRC